MGPNMDEIQRYSAPRSTTKNRKLAMKLYRIGAAHVESNDDSEAIKNAAQSFRLSAELGLTRAQYQYGLCLMNGQGVDRNPVEAVRWFAKVAEKGVAKVQHNLGIMYLTGEDIPKDMYLATFWLQKASAQGVGSASYSLGFLYLKGDDVPQDHTRAMAYFNLAATQQMHDARDAFSKQGIDIEGSCVQWQ